MMFVLFTFLTISMFMDSLYRKKYILHTDYLDYLIKNNKGYIFYSKYVIVGIIFLSTINIFIFIVFIFYLWDMFGAVKALKKLRSCFGFNGRTIWYKEKEPIFSRDLGIDLLYLCQLIYANKYLLI